MTETERQEAMFLDCLEFAKEYAFHGSPRAQAEAINCLEAAIKILRGEFNGR